MPVDKLAFFLDMWYALLERIFGFHLLNFSL